MLHLLPRQPAPALSIKLTDGRVWKLQEQAPPAYTLLIVFRHHLCSVCEGYLKELEALYDVFLKQGVYSIAASVDGLENTKIMAQKLGITSLPLGCELSIDMANEWGLFISSRRKNIEPEMFFEPASYLIDSNGNLFFSSIQSMPFGRASLSEISEWIPKIARNNIPARGELRRVTKRIKP